MQDYKTKWHTYGGEMYYHGVNVIDSTIFNENKITDALSDRAETQRRILMVQAELNHLKDTLYKINRELCTYGYHEIPDEQYADNCIYCRKDC